MIRLNELCEIHYAYSQDARNVNYPTNISATANGIFRRRERNSKLAPNGQKAGLNCHGSSEMLFQDVKASSTKFFSITTQLNYPALKNVLPAFSESRLCHSGVAFLPASAKAKLIKFDYYISWLH